MTSSEDDFSHQSNTNQANQSEHRRMNTQLTPAGIELRLLVTSRDAGAVIGMRKREKKKKTRPLDTI
jgi:hypothetical protein